MPGLTAVAAGVAMSLAGSATGAVAGSGVTERVSISSTGGQSDQISGRIGRPALSFDGRYVAFDSLADNLVPGDTNGVDDVFVRDRTAGTTTRVSVSSAGVQGNGASGWASVSADGRYVAFQSDATSLVPGDTNSATDVFVHDMLTGKTTRVSVSSDGAQANGPSFAPAISADGSAVAFASNATNLVSGGRKLSSEVYVHSLVTGKTTLASVSSSGVPGNRFSAGPAISGDGSVVAFTSFASNLVPGITNDADNVFVHNLKTGKTINVSVSSPGAQGNGNSYTPAISGNGDVVAFSSEATNLVPGDTQPLTVTDVFVHTVSTGVTQRVSVSTTGGQANGASAGPDVTVRGGADFGPTISADGTLVAFDSIASDLVPGDSNECTLTGVAQFTLYPGECPDVFVRDLVTGVTQRVSVSSAGDQSNDTSEDPAISGDGSTVAFFTLSSNLGPGDTNTCSINDQVNFTDHPGQCPDIYVHSG
jgi:archaellum component FlaF (FlaF/FlaG flagellin family)